MTSATRSSATSSSCASPPTPKRPGSRRRCAIRCSRAASGSGRCSRLPPPAQSAWMPKRCSRSRRRSSSSTPTRSSTTTCPRWTTTTCAAARRPPSPRGFGEDVAILAGDGLYAEAFVLLLGRQQGEPQHVLEAIRELAVATGVQGMVGGQYIDISGASDLRRLHELKTGRLIGASVGCVLLLADRPQTATLAYRSFAAALGVLFQLLDDIPDITGTDDALGKPRGSDERQGKRTYVSEFGLERARELAAESHRKARAALAQASAQGDSTQELEQITDFIVTRTS